MTQCIFCRIVAGEVPNYTVYEDADVLAFLDVHPCSTGHTVVIPKKHLTELKELSEHQWEHLMLGLHRATMLVDEKLKPAGLNIGINNRPAAGQAVPHVHWHIIPRYEKDGGGSMHSIVRMENSGEVAEVAKLFE